MMDDHSKFKAERNKNITLMGQNKELKRETQVRGEVYEYEVRKTEELRIAARETEEERQKLLNLE